MLLTILSVLNLATCAYIFHLASIPPQPQVPEKERTKGTDLFPSFVEFWRATFRFYQMVVCTIAVCEIGACILKAEGKPLTPEDGIMLKLCPKSSLENTLYPDARLPVIAWIGCIIATLGSSLRLWSQRLLGRFFTWELSIRPGHKLYTAGPYSFVRHPSYTGAITMFIGNIIFGFARGTYLGECIGSSYPTAFKIGGTIFVAYLTLGAAALLSRSGNEDEMLKKEFGKEWEEWAGRTRYRVLPGVF